MFKLIICKIIYYNYLCCTQTNIDIIVLNGFKISKYSNCNWTFMALNLPFTKTLRHNRTKNSQPSSVFRKRKEVMHDREQKGNSKTKVCLGIQVGFKLPTEGNAQMSSGRAFQTVGHQNQNYSQTV